MSTIKAVEKLRTLPRHGTNGFGAVVTANEETVEAIADEIESEAAEMQAFCERVEKAAKAREELEVFGTAYMPLPLDAWGEPIRTDDLMACTAFEPNDFDGKRHVLAVSYGLWVDKDGFEHLASETRHVKPRTLEDVLFEFGEEFEGEMDEIMPIIVKYAEEIRVMFGEVD